MPLYLALDATSRQRLRQGLAQADVEPIGATETLLVFPNRHAHPDEAVEQYDATVDDFVPVVAVATTTPILSRGAWMDRIGGSNEELLHQLRLDPATPLALRAKLERFHSELLRRADVDVRHLSTVTASNELANLFFAYGRITDKAAFIAMLLAEAPIT